MSLHFRDYVLVGLAAVFLVGVNVLFEYKKQSTGQPLIHVPVFKAHECFVRNGIRETWEPQADGKVIMVGVLKYLLMDQSEADRKAGGTKHGYYETIDLFDSLHRKVLCPEGWRTRK